MDISAITPWFGSKRGMAKEIVRQLGAHRAYWEPFCGSIAVLLAKPRGGHETINDLHADLMNLIRVLANEESAVRIYRMLARTLMHEEQFAESASWLSQHPAPGDEPDLQRAYHYFVNAWQGRNGFEGTVQSKPAFTVRWTSTGGHEGKRFRSAVESIPGWHERLRGVTILRRDGFAVLEKIEDREGTVVYCDPPYLNKSVQYVMILRAEITNAWLMHCGVFRKRAWS